MEHPNCLYASAKREVQRFARACLEAATARESEANSNERGAHSSGVRAGVPGSDTAVMHASAASVDFEMQAARVWNSSRWWPWAAERYLEHVLGKTYWQQFGDADFNVLGRLSRRAHDALQIGKHRFRDTRRATGRVEMNTRNRRGSETRFLDLLVELEDERSERSRLRLLTALEAEVDRMNGAD